MLPNYDTIWQENNGWIPNKKQQDLFQQIYAEIIEVNQFLNLTRITEPDEFWEKHLWDSLAPILPLNLENQKVIDIGTGAGFPGLPAAIAFPESEITLVDSTRKKINFLNGLITKIKLENVKTLAERVENIGQQKPHRESYDLGLIRAVANVSVCAEYTLPLLKIGGLAIVYRGEWNQTGEHSLNLVLKKLGGKLERIEKITTPLTNKIRHNIFIRKIKKTPLNFPRKPGEATRKPLFSK